MLKLAIARSNFALVLLVSLRAAGGTCFDLGSARAIGPRDSVEESVGAGDFNRDGMLDVIFVRPTWPGTVQLLLNQGDGRFQIGAQYTVGDGAHKVSVADVNGDGKLDVVVACAMSDNLSVLMAKGDGTFNPAINYSVGTNLFGGGPTAE